MLRPSCLFTSELKNGVHGWDETAEFLTKTDRKESKNWCYLLFLGVVNLGVIEANENPVFIPWNCAKKQIKVKMKVYEEVSLLRCWKCFEWIIKQLLNSAFVGCKELCGSWRMLSTSACRNIQVWYCDHSIRFQYLLWTSPQATTPDKTLGVSLARDSTRESARASRKAPFCGFSFSFHKPVSRDFSPNRDLALRPSVS